MHQFNGSLMDKEINPFFNDEFTIKYDDLIKKQNWYGAEILLGMIFEYLKTKDKILDIGIGTGLSATGFHSLGLEVYGLDYSNEMLEVCRQKNIAADLKQFDLNNTPLPYPSDYFDHISANAVIYFIDKLDNLFEEISRIIKEKGIWAFIFEENIDPSEPEIIEKPHGKNGLITYKHSQHYILDLMKKNGFTLLKKIEFVADNFQMEGKPVSFVLYVTEA
jgi:predicted TPR repeat methyltransferase